MKRAFLFALCAILMLFAAAPMTAQGVVDPRTPDATIAVPPPADPVVAVALRRLECNLDPDAPSARVTIGFYRQSGVLDHEASVAVTDGDPATTADDMLTGRGVEYGGVEYAEPLGIILALQTPVAGEIASSPAFQMRKRAMTWLAMNHPALLEGAVVP